MNVWQRQAMVGILTFLGFTFVLLGFTFIAFPFEQWSDLWTRTVLDLPYVFLVFAFSLTMGVVVGLTQGWVWKRSLHSIDHQLDEIVKGNTVAYQDSDLHEMQLIEATMKKIEEKFEQQASLAQKVATERAEDREKSLQEVVVQERNRLARELHDSVSQQLFAASMMMSAVNDSEEAKTDSMNKQLKMVENMIHQSQLEMRALLLHLRPVALKDKTLAEGVEELLYELTQKVPMEIDWTIEEVALDKGLEDQLFRILQESVSNTLRHAKADSLSVMLLERDHNIILRVVDDGIGFDVEEEKTSSYGLQNMNERAIEVGGSLKLVSLKEQGTRLEVKVPYRKKEEERHD
ncbi:sensor histidine kinase [Halobacillus locisalis]|uniref:Sensor histidine kinase n=1 Tax=Halobacillus locisalis TaxID=220753 RepID=A0A838CT94_9BACI|nr:sensor histidine kinase [Halobacillus locisalis]MBA2175118.1 sensor histidine kinase [Halobacillus locisalis]